MNVLFVCHGNINRSAAAHVIADKLYPQHKYRSAGVSLKAGKAKTAKKMRDTLAEMGYSGEPIKSRRITYSDIEWADVVFYMDIPNLEKLEAITDDRTKFVPLASYLDGVHKIPDPAFAKGTEMHHQVICMIEMALRRWISEN